MKKAFWRSFVVLLILSLSVGIGFLYCRIYERYERTLYPIEYSELVGKYSSEYGVPEVILYSVIKAESNFQSNAVSHAGAVGLMQITPATCDWIAMRLGETSEPALLYDPDTNVRYGAYLLSYLKLRYENWDTVFAAYNAGHGNVDKWLADPSCSDGNGVLKKTPFPETAAYIDRVNKNRSVYERLYFRKEEI